MRLLVALLAIGSSGCALSASDYDGDGWSTDEGDCDDYDPTIHAGARELLRDGIDQDCDDADTIERAKGLEHTCDLDEDGRIWCDATADAHYGQLDVPVPEPGVKFVQIAAGDFHTCALDDRGFISCWGDDTYGQSSPPRAWNGFFTGVDASFNRSIGDREGKKSLCWGDCPINFPQQN